MDIEGFKAELECTPNRVNNIPVPMGSVYTMADKDGIVTDNVMLKVDNLRAYDPIIILLYG